MIKAAIPIALQVLIDDAGWWSGKDGRENGEPARTGIPRDHVPEDYLAIAMLGQEACDAPPDGHVFVRMGQRKHSAEVAGQHLDGKGMG